MDGREIIPVILCGGSGTRLWPRSRESRPKPFLRLLGDRTLFEETLSRFSEASQFAPPVIVTGAAHLDLVEGQSQASEVREIIVEPEPRQTAAALALAALRLDQDAIMLVCPSDHFIGDPDAFREAAEAASELAAKGWLVCITVTPSAPDTRFGYVRRGEPLEPFGFRVAEFVEKPNQARAMEYLASGLYAWNAGIFAFKAGDYLRELRRFRPELAEAVEASAGAGECNANRFFPEAASFAKVVPESLDYAVMENTDRAALVTADMNWSDIGNWNALFAAREKDSSGNAVSGAAQLIDCENVLVDTDGPRVHLIGLNDIVVVVDGDDILIASASGAAHVGKLAKTENGFSGG
jgi:mannose-1-phosphate guanylyltransferase/mannose-1-phosphate guanylyltransferase/mannose-6-phosphate isomerase